MFNTILAKFLATDSLTEMENHADLYHTLLQICSSMAKHQNIVHLFQLLPGEKRSLFSYLEDLYQQASIVAKFHEQHEQKKDGTTKKSILSSTFHSSSTSTSSDTLPSMIPSLTTHIINVYTDVKAALQQLQVNQATTQTEVDTAMEQKNDTAATPDYVTLLTPHKFSEVPSFPHHHYWSQYQSTGVTNRQFVRRLATEYSDLSRSVPLNPESSVFLRVHESKMGFCQFLIIAPTDTPYARGCFLL